jgi:hypothetical protein
LGLLQRSVEPLNQIAQSVCGNGGAHRSGSISSGLSGGGIGTPMAKFA